MSGIPTRCQPFQDEIDALETEIQGLQEDLQTAAPPQKPGIIAQIRADRKQILTLAAQLQVCIDAPSSNLVIAGVERTQAIQYFLFNGQGSGFAANNTVPMVAKKELILRVYVNRTTLHSFPIPSTVTGRVTYAGHPNLSPINGPIAGAPSSSIDRGNADHTLNFRVPAGHCKGWVTFNITVFDPTHAGDAAYASKVHTFSLNFDNVPLVRIHGVLIHYTGRGMNIPAPSGIDLINTLVWVGRVFPIAGFTYTACEVIDFPGDLAAGGGGCGVGFAELMNTLSIMRSASGTKDIYVGLLPAGVPNSGVAGCGGGGVAVAYVNESKVLAQEIGHAFGRLHAPPRQDFLDPNYPTYNSFPAGSIGEYGFDSSDSVVPTPFYFDYMGISGVVWTSPYTYIGLKNAIAESQAAAHPDRAGEHLYLNFRMHYDGKVDLLPSYTLPGPAATLGMGLESPVRCHLVNAAGEVILVHRCFFDNPHYDPEAASFDLHQAVPWDPATKSVNFLRDGKVTHRIDVEEYPPELILRPPKRAEKGQELMRLEWEGKHAKKLRYLVRYTYDGGKTWRAVAADLTSSSHVVNLSMLPGGDHCRLQVVASSGLRTTTAETEYFKVKRKARQASILSPEPGPRFRKGESVVLIGGGHSPDFATPEFEEVLWTSNRDGLLGVGFQVVTHTLSVGRHQITVTVPDGLGGKASANVSVSVKN